MVYTRFLAHNLTPKLTHLGRLPHHKKKPALPKQNELFVDMTQKPMISVCIFSRLALGELGCATCGLEAVLHGVAGLKTPVPQGFSALAKQFNP